VDEGNPVRVGGAFGDKSVLEMPEYAAACLDARRPAARAAP
jgi:hypothetical protein